MAKNNKSKANLENIAKEGALLSINEAVNKEADISKKIPMWAQYLNAQYGEDQALAMYETIRRDPVIISPLIEKAILSHGNNLVTEVKKDPRAVVMAIEQGYVVGLASKFFGDDNYREIKETLENNGDIRGIYLNTFEGDLWKDIVANATEEAIRGSAEGHIKRTTQKEIIKNLTEDKVKYNANKASTYLTSNIQRQEAEAQNESYKEMGLAYTQTRNNQQ